jgi:hypothetical protein
VNSIGTNPSSDFWLPLDSGPSRIGQFEFHNRKTTFVADEGVTVLSQGSPVTRVELSDDLSGNGERLSIGSTTLYLIKRGERFGIRVKDTASKARREFTERRWFPIRESYRIVAKFVSYEEPREIPVANVLGDINRMSSPGYASFTLAGKQWKLEPVIEGGRLLFIFADSTNRRATYPAGRYLYTDPAINGRVTLDFNQAMNPPCAFTSFATCPLPPRQNRLAVAIEAGELNYHLTKPLPAGPQGQGGRRAKAPRE